jgi:hypothetical protein
MTWGAAVWLVLMLLTMSADAPAQKPMGGVKITSRPAGATVIVDGAHFGKTPLLAELPVGVRKIEIQRKGYKTVTRKVKVAADKIARVDVKLAVLKKKQTKAPKSSDVRVHDTSHGGQDSGPGTVTVVTSPPGLTIFIDDYYIPQPTPVAFDVKAGIYDLVIEQKGEVVFRKTIYVQAGRTLDLDLVIRKTRKIDYSDPWK